MKKFLSIIAALAITGCTVGYKPYSYMSGGYKDTALGNGKHTIEYVAYKSTTEKILPRWHKRASEVCLSGYDVLELNRNDDDSPITLSPAFSVARNDAYITGIIQCKN